MRKHVLHIIALFLFVNVNAQIQPVPVEINKWGGYIGTLAYEPGNPTHVLAGGGRSGLFESLDSGRTWGHVDSLPAYSLISVSFAPQDPNTIIATSRQDTRVSQISGIWLSIDKGQHWTNQAISLPLETTCTENAGAYAASWIPNSDSVIVGTDCGVAISPNKGNSWQLLAVYPSGNPTPDFSNLVGSVLAVDANNFVADTVSGTYWTDDRGVNWHLAGGMPINTGGCANSLTITPTERKFLFYYAYDSPMLYSADRGRNWHPFGPYGTPQNQPPFVRATLASRTNNHVFHLYVGDGTGLSRVRLDSRDTSTWASATPEPLAIAHLDPQDIIFHPRTKMPYVLAGDFGIQVPTNSTASKWASVGGGREGLNGLEVRGIGVQSIFRGSFNETNVYVTTWHNQMAWSSDGGSTWVARPVAWEATNLEANGPSTTDRDARISLHVSNWALHLYGRGFELLTTSLEPIFRNNEDMGGLYFRYFKLAGIDCILARKDDDYYLVKQAGGEWKRFYRFTPSATETALLNAPSISYQPDGTPIIYQPYESRTDGQTTVRLKKITLTGTPEAPNATVTPLPMNGFQSLGQMYDYWGKSVFASSPTNPQFLIAADAGTNQMKKSRTGGLDWQADALLTNLVTDNGTLNFSVADPSVGSQAQVIYFNPYNKEDIYVATVQSGIIYSRDGGESWNRIIGSKKVTHVSSMGFTPAGMVYFGSQARGLWKFNSRSFTRYPFYFLTDSESGIRVTDPSNGASNLPLGSLGPDKCPACRLDILKKGAIKNLQIFSDRNLTVFVSDMNSLFTFNADAKGSENLKFVQSSNLDTEMHPLITQVEKSNRIVKGVITEYGKIKALITAEPRMEDIPASLFFRSDMLTKADLKNYVAPPPPTLKLSPAYEHYNPVVKVDKEIPGYMAVVKQGDSITLRGSGFAPPGKENNLITVWVGNQMITEKLVVDSDGAFSIKLEVPRRAGPLRITVSQETAYGTLKETVPIEILSAD